ncbi:hypothetical protein BCR44DRAFT_1432881 [Catenaria anguillulae PL171]|uniref:UV excision repair protein RAD23 n=1 Tax=Catenaria anguillulae PL171 TaxID=765915 RepID=A0A1Y2HNI5_9FUNG|nr:hypothetical protein BCR44DRAFT_1432881 [Catenaria anguillulae PL171]
MKLTVKTLAQKQIHLQVEPTTTVGQVKEMLQQGEGFEVAAQKLIYSGKILTDDQTIDALKPKPAAAAAAPAPAAAPATPAPAAAAAPSTPAAPTTPVAAAAPAAPATPAAPSTPAAPADPSMVMGSAFETAVTNMMEMGYPRDQVVRAMRAAFNNPDRAFEYLMNVAHLQQMAGANPQLAQLIQANPEMFLQMLLGGGGEGTDEEGDEGDMMVDADGNPLPPGARVIQVSEEEKAAIDRLCALGFDRNLVIEAYFACDKNEEMAANYLFDNQFE